MNTQLEPIARSHPLHKARRSVVPLLAVVSILALLTASAPSATAQTGIFPLRLQWSSTELDSTSSVAWGDVDSDGDLDLAAGNWGDPNRLYRNDNGTLTTNAVWSSNESDLTYSVAWGDYNGDGDLDLAVGNQAQPIRLYRNDGVSLTTGAVWSSVISDTTLSVAWGDYDGDGDLDLAAGNSGQNRLYRNDSLAGTDIPIFALVWSSAETDSTYSVAWGDVDNDGDLDLAAGNWGQPNRLYRNTGGTLILDAWAPVADNSRSVAWGDVDGDGDLDLAVGNYGLTRRTQLYRNTNGVLSASPVWISNETGYTTSVVWGDYDGDGDLDLAVGSRTTSNRLYRNDGGALTASAVWSSLELDYTESLAWGDVDGDGDLDLAAGNDGQSNRLFRNDSVALPTGAAWSSSTFVNNSYGAAWGDVDGDGDLDLAVGNSCSGISDPACRSVWLYRNNYGALNTSPTWFPVDRLRTINVAWGDYDGDGDLDLAAAGVNRLYRNNGGTLTSSAVYSTTEGDFTESLAWGDYDNDGDLDFAVANSNDPARLYRNDTVQGSGASTTVFTVTWSSPITRETSTSVAWGDVDGDGDLDLAVGYGIDEGLPNRLYRNDGVAGNTPLLTLMWSSDEADDTQSVAWGDVDGDDDLDLAVGNARQPNRLYRNDGGTLTTSAVWSSLEADETFNVAWGDYDNDGDLDLAVGNGSYDISQSNRLYRNDDGTLTIGAVWSSDETNYTNSVAWGDVDSDGDLDLAVANFYGGGFLPNRLYVNNRAALVSPAPVPIAKVVRPAPPRNADFYSTPMIWPGPTIPLTYTLFDPDGNLVKFVRAFYSPDGGGQWLPAVAASNTLTTNLAAGYSYQDSDAAGGPSFNWVDISGTGTQIFLGDDQVAGPFPIGFSFPFFNQTHTQFWISSNGWLSLSPPVGAAVTNYCLPSVSAPANLLAPFWDDLNPSVVGQVRYQLVDPNTLVVSYLGVPRFGEGGSSLTFQVILRRDGSITFQYQTMTGTLNSATIGFQNAGRNLAKQAACNTAYVHNSLAGRSLPGTSHAYYWDVFGSGFLGQNDNVVFRIEAVPAISNTRNTAAGPYLYGAYAAQTFPFRVRGTQVRVMNGGTPAPNALVYRLPEGQTLGGELFADHTGQPFHTDALGYLQGRGQINLGDQLFALAPITATDAYTLYYTSGAPTPLGVNAHTVGASGVQTLTVSAANPLLLFNLFVSLEWNANNDPSYLEQLEFNLQQASRYLYDFTNGQAALGQVVVEQNADDWAYSHIVVHANNRLRPFAIQGGVVTAPTVDPQHSNIIYDIGQVHMGATWNRYGAPGQNLGDDWSIILAHELSHFLFFLDDTYLGLDANGFLIPVSTCVGSAMGDLYSNPDNTEFIADEAYWQTYCAQTLTEQLLGRNEWETIQLWYPPVVTPIAINSGPSLMPFNLTTIDILDPITSTETLVDPTFYLDYAGGGVSSSEARAFLLRDDQFVIDLGSPVGGQNRVVARGAKPGDRLCVFDRPFQQYGCEVVVVGDDRLTMEQDPTWAPVIQISPVTSQTFTIQVSALPAGLSLQARLYPEYGPGESVINLSEVSGAYVGTFTLSDVTLAGSVQVWVNEPATETDPRRETIVAFTIGGNPGLARGSGGLARGSGGLARGSGGLARGSGGLARGSGAPLVSPDGQMIFFTENPIIFDEGDLYAVQSMAGLPPLPSGRTMIGQGYSLFASQGAPVITGSISFQYLSNDVTVAGADENGLTIYFWNGSSWSALPTVRNPYFNVATAPSQGVGVYALMSSIQVPLTAPGWNLFAYLLQESQPVAEALRSIDGYYTTVYGYRSEDAADPWEVYQVGGPPYLNDLSVLEAGRGYWISATQAVTVHLSPAAALAAENSLPASPPDTFYGEVRAGTGFTPAAGMIVEARVNGVLCGRGSTQAYAGQIVYVVDVEADDETGSHSGCGRPGRAVTFWVGGQAMMPTAAWDNNQLNELALGPARLYLPVIRR